MIGIYKITNKINGHAYIGQSVNIQKRLTKHKHYEQEDSHYPLYRAFQKYGIENFLFEILEECTIDELDNREIYWIQYYDTFKNGYNQTSGGSGPRCCGQKLSINDVEEIEQYLINSNKTQSEIALLFKVSTETVQGINTGRYWARPNKQYPIHDYTKDTQEHKCCLCGVSISNRKATMCPDCAHKQSRKVERPDAITLAQEIVETNFCAVGRKYGVSDNAIRKWCKGYGLSITKKELKNWLKNNNI